LHARGKGGIGIGRSERLCAPSARHGASEGRYPELAQHGGDQGQNDEGWEEPGEIEHEREPVGPGAEGRPERQDEGGLEPDSEKPLQRNAGKGDRQGGEEEEGGKGQGTQGEIGPEFTRRAAAWYSFPFIG
jgi:hypothetical protein